MIRGALELGGTIMAANSGFPLSLDVKGYRCLYSGETKSRRKTQRLLEAGLK